MAVLTDPRYITVAAIAAQGLGAGPKVGQAILAQFSCEKGGEWPPKDNNPGNVHVGPMSEVGWHLPHGSGDGGACALFPSPENGASGYAAYIGHHVLYPAARQAIARDDANAYIAAVTGVGYGTNRSCWQQNYNRLSKSYTPPPGAGAGAGAGSTGGASGTADQWNAAIACFTTKHPTGVTRTAPTVPAAQLPDLVACANANGIAITLADVQPYAGQSLSAIRDALAARGTIPPADPSAIVPDIAGAVNTAVAGAIGAVVPLVVGGLVLVVAAALLLGGTRDALGG